MQQICHNVDYFQKSMAFFKREIERTVTNGLGKMSVSTIQKLFKLEAEMEFGKTKELLKNEIFHSLSRGWRSLLEESVIE